MPLSPAAPGENNVKKVTSVHSYASESGQNNSALQLVPLHFVGPLRAAQVCAYKARLERYRPKPWGLKHFLAACALLMSAQAARM